MNATTTGQRSNSIIKKRVFATLLDWAVIIVLLIVLEIVPIILASVSFLESVYTNPILITKIRLSLYILVAFFTLFWFLAVMYYFTLWQNKHEGQTIGKMFQGLQVVIKDENDKIELLTKEDLRIWLIRFLGGILDNMFWGLVGLIAMYRDKDNRSLSDLFSKTVVIEEKSEREDGKTI